MTRSSPSLSTKVEILLNGAVAFASAGPSRFPRLAMAACDAVGADGCVISHSAPVRSTPQNILHSHSRRQALPEGRIRALLIRESNTDNGVICLTDPGEGGPAIIVSGYSGAKLLIYRLDPDEPFSEQDSQLILSLWRSCVHHVNLYAVQCDDPVQTPMVPYSRRGLEVLGSLLDGLAEKQVAARLGISKHTVHGYVKNLYRQHGVSSKAELLMQFFRAGSEIRTNSSLRQALPAAGPIKRVRAPTPVSPDAQVAGSLHAVSPADNASTTVSIGDPAGLHSSAALC